MGEDGDNILSFFVFGSAIALVVCGIYVAKPNLHGTKFKPGMCNITSAGISKSMDDFPTCSCGKSCSRKYPCIEVYGYFTANTSSSKPELGTFHKDYSALQKKCLTIPDCDKDFNENEARVDQYFRENIFDKVTNHFLPGSNTSFYNYSNSYVFSCWGHDGDIYFDHNYSMMLVYVSTIIPAVCLVIALLLSLCFGSSEQKENIFYIVGLPFILIAGIVVGIYSVCFPDNCECNCFKKNETEAPSTMTRAGDLQSADSTATIESRHGRRNSLIRGIIEMERQDRDERRSAGSASITFDLGTGDSSYTEPSVPPLPTGDASEGIIGGPVYNISSTTGQHAPPPSYDEALMNTVPSAAAPSYEEIMRSTYNE